MSTRYGGAGHFERVIDAAEEAELTFEGADVEPMDRADVIPDSPSTARCGAPRNADEDPSAAGALHVRCTALQISGSSR